MLSTSTKATKQARAPHHRPRRRRGSRGRETTAALTQKPFIDHLSKASPGRALATLERRRLVHRAFLRFYSKKSMSLPATLASTMSAHAGLGTPAIYSSHDRQGTGRWFYSSANPMEHMAHPTRKSELNLSTASLDAVFFRVHAARRS